MRSRELTHALGATASDLLTPALVIDLDAVQANVEAVMRRVGDPERWRPHVKTVKQGPIIDLLLEAGVVCFKCATLPELTLILERAEAASRTVDVLLAYPPQPAALRAFLEIRRSYPSATVSVLADGPAHLSALDDWAQGDSRGPIAVMLDVDVGMGRTGTPVQRWRDGLSGDSLEKLTAVSIRGVHGYDGHHEFDQKAQAHAAYDQLCELARELQAQLEAPLDVITSGTHSYVHALAHDGLTQGPWRGQISPGTVVLSDRRSAAAAHDLGLRQAAFVASRVISVGEGRVTLDAGSKGMSPDVAPPSCHVIDWPGLAPQRASEEHLPCKVKGSAPGLGELVWLVPSHVCTTVNLYRKAIYLQEGAFAGVGDIAARSRLPFFPSERDVGQVH